MVLKDGENTKCRKVCNRKNTIKAKSERCNEMQGPGYSSILQRYFVK